MRPNTNTDQQPTVTRFALGQTYITPGAEEALMIAGQTGVEFLRRHMCADWSELSDEDVRENELSLRESFRVLNYLSHGQRPEALDYHRGRSQFNNNSSLLRILKGRATRRECLSHSRRLTLISLFKHVETKSDLILRSISAFRPALLEK